MYLMMDIEISCKGHCESFSHFVYLVSYSVIAKIHWADLVVCCQFTDGKTPSCSQINMVYTLDT